jgi:hypothetical protein
MSAANQGLLLPQTSTTLTLNFRQHGALVTTEFYAFTTVIGAVLVVFEVNFIPRGG